MIIVALSFQCCFIAPLRTERYPKEEPLDEVEDADWVIAANATLMESLAGDTTSNVTTD